MRSIFVAVFMLVVIGLCAQEPMGKVYTMKVRKPKTNIDVARYTEVVLDCECDCDDFKVIENDPEFPGGDSALANFFKNAPYPTSALYIGAEGSVTVKFIVGKSGKVNSVTIAKKSDYKELDNAALAYVASMPGWTPGRQRGKTVNVLYETTITYKLM